MRLRIFVCFNAVPQLYWNKSADWIYHALGMLLEQKKEEVKKLFLDSKLLEENINVALKTLEQ